MPAECSPPAMQFARLDGRAVVADFGGGVMTSDAGALPLGATDRAIGLVDCFAACFSDGRAVSRVVHDVATLVGQRVFGIALGYEDLIDHDELRHDPVLGVVLGRLEARRPGCAPLAGKSTLNRRVCPIICVSGAMGVALSVLSALRPESDLRTGSQTAPSRRSTQWVFASGRQRCGSPGTEASSPPRRWGSCPAS